MLPLTYVVVLLFVTISMSFAKYDSKNDENSHTSYKFEYGVQDPETGDIKSHHEIRLGKEVNGMYTVREADGTTRIVKYTAGPHKGFNAVVQKTRHIHYPTNGYERGSAFIGHGGWGLQSGLYGIQENSGSASQTLGFGEQSGTTSTLIAPIQFSYVNR